MFDGADPGGITPPLAELCLPDRRYRRDELSSIYVPKGIHQSIAARAALRGISIQDYTAMVLGQWIREHPLVEGNDGLTEQEHKKA